MSRRLFALEALILGPLSIFSFFQLLANVFTLGAANEFAVTGANKFANTILYKSINQSTR
jgi:hypothetical protein